MQVKRLRLLSSGRAIRARLKVSSNIVCCSHLATAGGDQGRPRSHSASPAHAQMSPAHAHMQSSAAASASASGMRAQAAVFVPLPPPPPPSMPSHRTAPVSYRAAGSSPHMRTVVRTHIRGPYFISRDPELIVAVLSTGFSSSDDLPDAAELPDAAAPAMMLPSSGQQASYQNLTVQTRARDSSSSSTGSSASSSALSSPGGRSRTTSTPAAPALEDFLSSLTIQGSSGSASASAASSASSSFVLNLDTPDGAPLSSPALSGTGSAEAHASHSEGSHCFAPTRPIALPPGIWRSFAKFRGFN